MPFRKKIALKAAEYHHNIVSANERASRNLEVQLDRYNFEAGMRTCNLKREYDAMRQFHTRIISKSVNFCEADFRERQIGRNSMKQPKKHTVTTKTNRLVGGSDNLKPHEIHIRPSTVQFPIRRMTISNDTPERPSTCNASDLRKMFRKDSVHYDRKLIVRSQPKRRLRSFRTLKALYSMEPKHANDYYTKRLLYRNVRGSVTDEWLNERLNNLIIVGTELSMDEISPTPYHGHTLNRYCAKAKPTNAWR